MLIKILDKNILTIFIASIMYQGGSGVSLGGINIDGTAINFLPFSLTADDVDFIISAQRAYCTESPVCQSPLSQLNDLNMSVLQTRLKHQINIQPATCCEKCKCDQICCCDANKTADIISDESHLSCVYPQIKEWYAHLDVYPHSTESFWMKSDCSDYDVEFESLSDSQNCYSHQTVNGTYSPPVFDTKNNITYANKYCAKCNNRSNDFLIRWDTSVECKDEPFKITTSGELMAELLGNSNCNLIFYPPKDIMKPTCNLLIDQCNVTGKWAVYDPFIKKACSLYTAPYAVLYANVFCYICNKEREENEIEKCFPDQGNPYDKKVMLRMLLRYNIDTSDDDITSLADISEQVGHCIGRTVYDSLQRTCVGAKCMPPNIFQKGGCVNIAKRIGGVLYRMFIVLLPKFTVEDVASVVHKIEEYISSWLDSMDLLGNLGLLSIHEKQPFYKQQKSSGKFPVVHIDLYIKNRYEELVDSRTINKLLDIKDTNINSNNSTKSLSNSYFVFFDHFDISYNAALSNITLHEETENGTRTTLKRVMEREPYQPLPLLHTMTLYPTSVCPLMMLNASFYNLSISSQGVFIGRLNVGLNKSEYIIQEGSPCDADKCVFVCLDTFTRITENAEMSVNVGKTFNHTVTIILSTAIWISTLQSYFGFCF